MSSTGAETPDDYKAWYDEAMVASNEAGFVGMSAAETIRALASQAGAEPPPKTDVHLAVPDDEGKAPATSAVPGRSTPGAK